MKKLTLFLILISTIKSNSVLAQAAEGSREDTLPKFLLKNVGNNRIIIGWVNNYPVVNQISIQRSFDSLTNYKTILTVPDPDALQNGYMDVKATNDHMFYRLYILLGNGNYLFSAAKKPKKDYAQMSDALNGKADTIMVNGKQVIIPANSVNFKIDSLLWGETISNPDYKKPPLNSLTQSIYVYTNREGNVGINLPGEINTKKYSLKFFEEDGTLLFELKDLKEKEFRLEKSNFYHAGWFKFELYENGKLLEKNKFYLAKDF